MNSIIEHKYITPILVIILVWTGYLYGKKSVHETVTVTVRDSIPFYVPAAPEIIVTGIPFEVDTASIIEDYYTQKIYHDTVRVTEYITLYLTDNLYNNALTGRKITYDLNIPYHVKSKPTRNAISIHADIGRATCNIMAGYRHKRVIYKVGYDMLDQSVIAGIGINIVQW